MSAIWGLVCFQQEITARIEEKMRKVYETRCRVDRMETCQAPSFFMSCGIQHITKQAKKERLPFYDREHGCCFTADCLLDNREQLLKELGQSDSSIPDGQLMYLAYQKWGMECLRHFRGLFSMAVYEERTCTLYLAVDQVASRCLYYYKDEECVAFSTLIEPIRACFPNIKTNELYRKDFLIAPGMMPNIMPTQTPYEGIYKLNPGTYLELKQEEMREVAYWNPTLPLEDCHAKTAKEYGNYFRKLYEQCVKDALRADGEIGIAMSSGLDSASVGVLAADLLEKEKKTLYSYTYVPSERGVTDANHHHVLDEREDVRRIAEKYPNILLHFLTNEGKNCYEDLEQCLDIMEIPIKASVNLPNLCEIYKKAQAQGCKIVLSGQAGNSTVSQGYIDDVLYDLYVKKKYITCLKYLNRYSKNAQESRKDALVGCWRYFHYADEVRAQSRLHYELENPFLKKEILEDYPLEERFEQGEITCLERIPVEQSMYQGFLYKKALYTYLGELETKLGLAFNVVLRDPTKDIRLLQFCYHLPYCYFAYQGTPRWLIRGNMQDLLPESLLNDWMRYGVQNSDWFLRMMRDWDEVGPQMCERLEQSKLKKYFDMEKIQDVMQTIEEREPKDAELLLQYLLFLCAAER